MFFAIITLITALSMAAVAAWFAIVGIMAIFAGMPIFALIMGLVVEAGKIVGVTWVYRNWLEKTKLKFMMIPVVIIAMLLTSMGIFGLLSKAHIQQNAPVGNNVAQIERLDQRISREQSKIDDAETVKDQLDEQVSTLIEYDKISGPNGSRAVKAGQKDQRDELAIVIDSSEDAIAEYEDKKFTLSSELRQLEIDVGPVKYIAALIYEDPKNQIENAVRIVIIAFIFVFDPMAILLLMAANFSFMQLGRKSLFVFGQSEDDDPDDTDPGGGLIELIDVEPEPIVKKKTVDSVQTKADTKDRAWLKDFPAKDKDVDGKMILTAIKRLGNRDKTRDEQVLFKRLRKLAIARNIPWKSALSQVKRASVSTRNSLLQK